MSKHLAPASAFQFAGETMQIGEVDGETTPISMLTRSSGVVSHAHWGDIVHDFDGMKVESRIPLEDLKHDVELGYLDTFTVKSEGLQVDGAIIKYAPDPLDPATRILSMASKGVPYQSSINWRGPTKIEDVPEGQKATANGREFTGPVKIVREWHLRAAAIAKLGQDPNTHTQFSADDNNQQEVEIMSTDDNKPEDQVADDADKDKQDAAPEKETPPAETQQHSSTSNEPDTLSRKEAQQFVQTFGDIGASWYLQGMTFAEATKKRVEADAARITELEEENKVLSAANNGTHEPANNTHPPKDKNDNADKAWAEIVTAPASAAASVN